MSDEATSFDIASTFVVMDRHFSATPVKVTEAFWADLEKDFGDFAGMSLISCFHFEEDWPTWEIHPKGDEFVCLLSGDVEMILKSEDGELSVRLTKPGSYVIVPKGTWHTARTRTPTSMMFVTRSEGTENRSKADFSP